MTGGVREDKTLGRQDRVLVDFGPFTVTPRQKRVWKGYLTGFAFVIPALVVYAVFVLYPFVVSIQYSFTDWDGAQPVKNWIGWDNYVRMFTGDTLWEALRHNLIWIILGSALTIALALTLAVLTSRATTFKGFLTTVFFLPALLSASVIGVIWGWLYHPDGLVNQVLSAVGLESITRGWLGDFDWALYAVLFAAVWGGVGFNFVIFLAAIRNIDQSLIEAASLDGANGFQRLRYVTLPGIRRVMSIVVVLALIEGFAAFDIVWVMTQGGPGTASELFATYAYREAFRGNDIAYGASVSTVITVLSLIASAFYLWFRDRED